ncbi:MAG: aminotransferase class I/II-fold pyridoxal phosphate-dependent enzyme [Acidimicrobiales bacterium]|jgi:succinyldiaminopimelate transaminase
MKGVLASADAGGKDTVAAGGAGLVIPVYPFDRLASVSRLAERHEGGAVDLSIGTPCDPPPQSVVDALASSGAERGYPSSLGTSEYREAALAWMSRRFGIETSELAVAACIGTKELVAGVPHWLKLRSPGRDTVLCPTLAYPTYEMGATLAGCRAVAVPARRDATMELSAISQEDADRALCLWVNSPGNPGGQLEDLDAIAGWGRDHGVPVFSDECYAEFTWDGPARTILSSGPHGVVAVHSLSKRSNLAGLRAGFYAGDPDLVGYLSKLRQHAGYMVPGPVQHAGAVSLGDDAHVEGQRATYRRRLERFAEVLTENGIEASAPGGSFYLWVDVPEDVASARTQDEANAGWALTRWLAERGGVLVAPGDTYGPAGAAHVRVALVQPDDRLELVAQRLAARRGAAGNFA